MFSESSRNHGQSDRETRFFEKRCHVSRRTLATVIVAVLATAALVACSGKSPAAPSTPGAVPSNATPEGSGGPAALAVEGTYTLYLINTSGEVVSSLPVNPAPGESGEVVLWAQVSGPGGLAQRGSVIFQACRGEDQDSRSGGRARNVTAD
jgi:hypothetical protein